MNPGLTEEGGKVAVTLIDSLKSQPMSIAMIVSNVILLIYLFTTQGQFHTERSIVSRLIADNQKQVQELLSKCIVPPEHQK